MYRFIEETAAGCMTREVKTVTRETEMHSLLGLFERDKFNAYPVTEDAHVIGLVTKFDFLNCFAFAPAQMVPRYEALMSRTVADIMNPAFIYVSGVTKLTRVLQLMVEHRTQSIPVIEGERLAGIISSEDVMRSLRKCATDD